MKNNTAKTKRALVIFCILTLISALIIPFLPLSGENRVYEDTVRLHVIAASDSEKDQELKLKIRDRVLSLLSEGIGACSDTGEARRYINSQKEAVIRASNEVLKENGSDDTVKVELGKEHYPEREYEGVTLPAGNYTSLRIIIGKGEGHNWWCILYPALCTGTAKPEKELSSAGFTPEQIRILTENENPRYKVKFKIVEFFERIFG